ncbi:MAG: 4Fe-4S binding protein [Verrucomicrobia bacterium]|nr:4Fe-4S binding protein [Deltaproteobacteria bacterium]
MRINPLFCTACGTCEYVCPVTLQVVTQLKRQTE